MRDIQNNSAIENNFTLNHQLAEELNKTVIKKFKKRKINSFFTDNIWGANLPNIQLLRKFNKEIHFLLCVIDVIDISKCARMVSLKSKNGTTITVFQKMLDESRRKLNMLWVDKGNEF